MWHVKNFFSHIPCIQKKLGTVWLSEPQNGKYIESSLKQQSIVKCVDETLWSLWMTRKRLKVNAYCARLLRQRFLCLVNCNVCCIFNFVHWYVLQLHACPCFWLSTLLEHIQNTYKKERRRVVWWCTEPSYSNENFSFKWEMPYLSHEIRKDSA